jgi:hypothetical protein
MLSITKTVVFPFLFCLVLVSKVLSSSVLCCYNRVIYKAKKFISDGTGGWKSNSKLSASDKGLCTVSSHGRDKKAEEQVRQTARGLAHFYNKAALLVMHPLHQ